MCAGVVLLEGVVMDLPPTVSHEIARLARVTGQDRLHREARTMPPGALDGGVVTARTCLFDAGIPSDRYAARSSEIMTVALVLDGLASAWAVRPPADLPSAIMTLRVLAAGMGAVARQSARLDEDFATAIFDGFYADDESVDPD